MTPDDLAAIRERANNATPGPWEADHPFIWAGNGEQVAFVAPHDPGEGSGQPESRENAKFIAAARTDIPALLDHIEELEGEVKRVEAQRRDCFEHADKWVTEADRLAARIAAARALHEPRRPRPGDIDWCAECSREHPCATIRALDGD